MTQYSNIISTMILNLQENKPLLHNVHWVTDTKSQRATWFIPDHMSDGHYKLYDAKSVPVALTFDLHLTQALYAYMRFGDPSHLHDVVKLLKQWTASVDPADAIDELLMLDKHIYQKNTMPPEQWAEMKTYWEHHHVKKNFKSEIETLEKKHPDWVESLKKVTASEDVYFLQMYSTLLEWERLKKDKEDLDKTLIVHEKYKKDIMYGYSTLSVGLHKGVCINPEHLQRLKKEYDMRHAQIGHYQLKSNVVNTIMADIQQSDVFKQLSEWAHSKPMFGEKTRHLTLSDLSSSQLKIVHIFMQKESLYKKIFDPTDINVRYAM